MINSGDGYNILPKLLSNTDTNFRIDLVGNETNEMICNPRVQLKESVKSDKVTIQIYNQLLGPYIEEQGVPDILILGHPGFEMHAQSWLVSDSGIQTCLDNGTTQILGCSYGTDESSLDRIYAQAYGFKISSISNNPFYLDHANGPDNNLSCVAKGAMDWGRQHWVLEKGNGTTDNELIELLDLRCRLLAELVPLYGDPSSVIFDMLHETEGHEHIIHIKDEIGFVYEDFVLVNMTNGEVLEEDIELDVTYIDTTDPLSPTQVTLIAAIIYRDYLNEDKVELNLEDESNLPMNMINEMLFGGEIRKTSDFDDEIINIIELGEFAKLNDYPLAKLKEFSNKESQNLLHMACIHDNLDIFELAYSAKIDPTSRDREQFTSLDICAEHGSEKVLTKIIESYPDLDLDICDPKGFTAMHRAFTYVHLKIAEILVTNGANPNPETALGVQAKHPLFEINK
ncbi:MAG: ankyrin repeat domain-containing protein [Saccharospirillaceae bacterium]|nr:ankyrin repeat domain-containing protein [Saccharospirillaceae bacterium]